MKRVHLALVALACVAALASSPACAAGAEIVDALDAKADAMLASYRQGAVTVAAQERREAYLLFEQIEPQLSARDPALTRQVEAILGEGGTLATLIQSRAPYAELASEVARLGELLPRVRSTLQEGADASVVFGQSLFIIVREGFEAILVVAAIAGYLRVSGHQEKLRVFYVFAGLAVVASFITALLFQVVAGLGAIDRELLEGITGLLAVIVLFYVSYWLLSKIEAERWMAFIKTRVSVALKSSSTLALGAISFLAVYREGFETVLFYQALAGSAQTPEAANGLIFGFLLGAAVLAALFLAFYTFGVKIPMREFFAVTGVLLYYLAFTFAGNAVRELQEAGVVSATAIAGLPTIDLVGFHPTVETLVAQLLLVLAAVFGSLFIFVVRPAAERLSKAALGAR